jgi:hypothetical protein
MEQKMRKLFLTTVAALAFAGSASAQMSNADFAQMERETGCGSKYNDDKKADIFSRQYQGKQMVVTGEVKNAEKGALYVRLLSSTLTFDLVVDMNDARSIYDLERGQRVKVAFLVTRQGGCILSFHGNNGVLQ